MAEYKSRFAKLGFYVNGTYKQFRSGVYKTTDKKEIEVLDKLTDATRVDSEPKVTVKETTETKAEEPKQNKKDTPKKQSNRKSSAK